MRRGIGIACVVSSAVLLWASLSVAATLLVRADGTGEYATIQAAIDAAAPGDVVSLADGIYRGDGNRDLDYHGKAITVRSESGDYTGCIIDCEGSAATPHRGFWFHTSEMGGSILDGVTIRGGYAADYGGGVFCQSLADTHSPLPRIRNCRLTANSAPSGAGIAFSDPLIDGANPGDVLPLANCLVDSNYGSGLFFDVGASEFTVATGSHFNDNRGAGAVVAGGFTGYWPGIRFVRCEFSRNDGDGFARGAFFNKTTLDSCVVSANGGVGIASGAGQDDGMYVSNSAITLNRGGGVSGGGIDLFLSLVDCTIDSNDLFGVMGDLYSYGFNVVRCRISNTRGGPGIRDRHASPPLSADRSKSLGDVTVADSEIDHNDGDGLDLENDVAVGRIIFTRSTVHDNVGAGIRFAASNGWGRPVAVIMDSLTVALNGGAGLVFGTDLPVTAQGVLIAFNGGPGVTVTSGSVSTLSCSDIFGNTGGDWIGPIAGQLAVAGNFSADPLFCDASAGLFSLRDGSPCLPGLNPTGADCGQVGALGAQCFTASPVITGVTDVPGDQGQQVQVSWLRSRYDKAVDVVGYAFFRKQARGRVDDPVEILMPTSADPKLHGWDYLLTVPAAGQGTNTCAAATLGDSTAAGPFETAFLVRALTANPALFFDSAPAHGHSVDNLAPEAPKNLGLADNKLRWDRCGEADFHHFTIYGSNENRLEGSVCLGQTKTCNFSTHGHAFLAYLVTTTDHSGNEGRPASTLGDVGATVGARPVTALHPASPNPFNPATVVRFELAAPGSATLRVYDVSGRLVRTLMGGEVLASGGHEVTWDGRNDAGAPVAAGIYLCRLASGRVVQSRTMMLVK